MPRRRKTAATSDFSHGLGEAFAPMIRGIVREEIGRILQGLARDFAGTRGPNAAPLGEDAGGESGNEATAAEVATRPGKRGKGNGTAHGETGA